MIAPNSKIDSASKMHQASVLARMFNKEILLVGAGTGGNTDVGASDGINVGLGLVDGNRLLL